MIWSRGKLHGREGREVYSIAGKGDLHEMKSYVQYVNENHEEHI